MITSDLTKCTTIRMFWILFQNTIFIGGIGRKIILPLRVLNRNNPIYIAGSRQTDLWPPLLGSPPSELDKNSMEGLCDSHNWELAAEEGKEQLLFYFGAYKLAFDLSIQ